MTGQLRLVVFSESIISDIGNPIATTVRAMCQAFAGLGHDVTHLEERGNPALMRMLQTRGYAPMRAFNTCYPLIRYRQYAVPAGAERSVWFGRETATIDAVVAFPGTPEQVMAELEARDNARLVRFWPGADEDVLTWMPLWTDPAVFPRAVSSERAGSCVVAYNNITEMAGDSQDRIALGTFDDPDWPYLAEVLAEARYQRCETVTMDASVDIARALLPVANGAVTELVDKNGTLVRRLTEVPKANDARQRALALSVVIERVLTRRLQSGA